MADPSAETLEEWTTVICMFLKDHVRRAGAKGLVVGMSGGIDSAVTAALAIRAVGTQRVLGVRMPAPDSDPADAEHGTLLCEHLGLEAIERGIGPIVAGLEQALETKPDAYVHGNAKARARMMFLYAEAQSRGYLVCGTGNKSELLIGYFTKYGDGGVDLEPIGDLYKTQVQALARHLGLPDWLLERPPSAGLHPGQTDEEDLGMTYAELDAALKAIELNTPSDQIAGRAGIPPDKAASVEAMVRRSEHKRHAPLVPKIGARTVGIDWRRSVHWDA